MASIMVIDSGRHDCESRVAGEEASTVVGEGVIDWWGKVRVETYGEGRAGLYIFSVVAR